MLECKQSLTEFFAYLKNHTIQKVNFFVQKFNFDKTPTFSRVFHPIFFFDNFSREIKVVMSTAT